MGGGGWYLNLEKNGSQKLFHFAEQPAVHPTAVQSRLFSKTFTNTTTSPPPRKKKQPNNKQLGLGTELKEIMGTTVKYSHSG